MRLHCGEGTPLINGANQSGSALITDGWTPGFTLEAGDAFISSAAGVREPYRDNVRFTVTAKVVADKLGGMVIPVAHFTVPTVNNAQIWLSEEVLARHGVEAHGYKALERLWERSAHGTRLEDLQEAYQLGVTEGRKLAVCRPVESEPE